MEDQGGGVISQGDGRSLRREGSRLSGKQDAIHDDFFWPYGWGRKRDRGLECPASRFVDAKRLNEPIIGQSNGTRPVGFCFAFGQRRARGLSQGPGEDPQAQTAPFFLNPA